MIINSVWFRRSSKRLSGASRITSMRYLRGNAGNTGCWRGSTYGYSGTTAWVTRGCRGNFKVCGPQAGFDDDDTDGDDNGSKTSERWKDMFKDSFEGTDGSEEEIRESLQQKRINTYKGKCYCQGYGDPYYSTADGGMIRLQGKCEYVMWKTKSGAPGCPFTILTTHEERDGLEGVAAIKHVLIKMFDKDILVLKQNRLLVSGEEKIGEYHDPRGDFLVTKSSSSQTFIAKACGVQISFKDDHMASVLLDSTYGTHVEGLCGNCNEDVEDDFLLANGSNPAASHDERIADEIGFSWKTNNPNMPPEFCSSLLPPAEPFCSEDDLTEAEGTCGFLKNSASVQDCMQNHMQDIQNAYASCVSDVCAALSQSNEAKVTEMKCKSATQIKDRCGTRGFQVIWPAETHCERQCGPNSGMSEFVPVRQATCSNPNPTGEFFLLTEEGCQCDEGYVLEGTQCVPESSCGCVDDSGNYLPVGAEILNDECNRKSSCTDSSKPNMETDDFSCRENAHCERVDGFNQCVCDSLFKDDGEACVADEQAMQEEEEQLAQERENRLNGECKCRQWGEPHLITFDRQMLTSKGTCTYVVSGTSHMSGTCAFRVLAKNKHRPGQKHSAFIDSVYIITRGVLITLEQNGVFKINGEQRFAPADLDEQGISISDTGKDVIVTTGCGVKVKFDGDDRLEVRVPNELGENLVGMCGNCDGVKNDLVTKDGTDVSGQPDASMVVANSWRFPNPTGLVEHDSCMQTEPELSCSESQVAEFSTVDKCGRLMDTEGPFGNCIQQLSDVADEIQMVYESCLKDACAFSSNPQPLICQSQEELAAMCAARGIAVLWRTADCPFDCPNHSSYNPLMQGCQPTCPRPQRPASCDISEKEGCECNEGYVYDNGKCIRPNKCGCFSTDKGYVPRNSSFVSSDCSKMYTCKMRNGEPVLAIESTGHFSCHEHARCVLGSGGQPQCVCKEGYQGTGDMCTPTTPPVVPVLPVVPPEETGESCYCSASGDPHIKQCDGGTLQVYNPCMFLFAAATDAVSDDCWFEASIKSIIHPNHPDRSFVRMVQIRIRGYTIRLNLLKAVTYIDESAMILSTFQQLDLGGSGVHTFPGQATIRLEPKYVSLVTACGVEIRFDGVAKAELIAHSSYSGKLKGLCGNFDGNIDNDRKAKNGKFPWQFLNKTIGQNAVAKQHVVPDTSDVPDFSLPCTPDWPTMWT